MDGGRCDCGRIDGTLYHCDRGSVFRWTDAYSTVDEGAAAMAEPSSGALLCHVCILLLRRSKVLDLTTARDIRVRMKLTISEYCRSHLTDSMDARRLSAALAALHAMPSTE